VNLAGRLSPQSRLAAVDGPGNSRIGGRWGLAASPQSCGILASNYERKGLQVADLLDDGPFFHGTIADLGVGEFLTAGRRSNYRPEIVMNHVYFTALIDGASLAAEIAAELAPGAPRPRVYAVEPTGAFENDPNVTDKKFPGNPTRSYRSAAPLRILGEITDWTRLTPEKLQMWRDRLSALLSNQGGDIIN
jgi:rifampin ADP-ribosylating transferase